jgi:hypothetical protein
MKRRIGFAVSILTSAAVWAQAPPPLPVPVPGGTVLPPLINLFFPGDVAAGFDGPNAEPSVITNFRGVTAIGYTSGSATDNTGKQYQVMTDIRVFQGHYVGAVPTPTGATMSSKGRATFIEI